MNAAEIAAALGDARREGRGWRCRCPVHGGHTLVLTDGSSGRLLATCWAGCSGKQVFAELGGGGYIDGNGPAPQTAEQVAKRRAAEEVDRRRRRAVALDMWGQSYPARGSIIERYWRSRGIILPAPTTIRLHPMLAHRESGGRRPAQVGIVEHVEHGKVGIHLTYLAVDGSMKATVNPAKRSLGPIGGGAVRLAPIEAGKELIVGEGIETVLSVMQATGLPGWAALSAVGVRNLILPPEAELVLIAADNDDKGTGEQAAYNAAERWISEGRRVRIALPPEPGVDFNDIVLGRFSPRAAEAGHVA
jgi:hypothetical protein